jgi:hypothetical protein
VATNFTLGQNEIRSNTVSTAAGASSTFKLYTGAAPTNADTAVTGTLLATLTGAATFGTSTSGTMTIGAITAGTAVATGTAGYCRIASSGGTTICDLTVIGTSGSDLNIATTSIVTGASVSITSGTIAEPYP